MYKNYKSSNGITLVALVITIVVLLILASISINMVIGENGIIGKASDANKKTGMAQATGKVQMLLADYLTDKYTNGTDLMTYMNSKEANGEIDKVTDNGDGTITIEIDGYEVVVKTDDLNIESVEKVGETKANMPEEWVETNKGDSAWYNYGNAVVNSPSLKGNMTPVIYTGAASGNKWANAITEDGSMFVWIPRYAYKITSNYHTNTAGTIEIKFIDTNNNFLDGTSGKPETDPTKITYTGDKQNEWLVHPAFTSNAENGGGFGELTGIWIGKFETTGDINTLTVKPGIPPLRNQTINSMWKAAKSTTSASFGESVDLKQHMMKNSEWGAVVYLGQSKYGTNGTKIAQNSSTYFTGGSPGTTATYTGNANQSTTQNAYGVYDLNGGAPEYVASYVNNGTGSLTEYGADLIIDDNSEAATSTAYKTVYTITNNSQSVGYNLSSSKKGDAIYEISNSYNSLSGTWYSTYSYFPYSNYPFFVRGGNGNSNSSNTSSFYFNYSTGGSSSYGFHACLAF